LVHFAITSFLGVDKSDDVLDALVALAIKKLLSTIGKGAKHLIM
jgi:hypothetical protein